MKKRLYIDFRTSFIIDDLVERGLFSSRNEVIKEAISLLQLKLIQENDNGDYHDDEVCCATNN